MIEQVKRYMLPIVFAAMLAAQAATIWLLLDTRHQVKNVEYVADDAAAAAREANDAAQAVCRELRC